MPEVGIIITANDKAKAVLGEIGKTGKASLSGIRTAAGKAGEAFKKLGVGFALFNQALELGKKALELFRVAITDTIRTALDFRKLGDPAIEAFKKMERNALILRARLGDILIPLAQGLSDAFNETGNSVIDLINANRKLIATKLADWLRDVAVILVKGVGVAGQIVLKIWGGWVLVIAVVKEAVNAFFIAWLKSTAVAAKALSALIGLFDKDLAASITGVGEAAGIMGDELIENMGAATLAAEEQLLKIEEYKTLLAEGVPKALAFVGEAHAAMMERIAKSTIGGIRTIEEQLAAYDKLGKKADETTKQVADNQIATVQSVVETTVQLLDQAASTMLDSTKTQAEKAKAIGMSVVNAARQALVSLVITEITALIAKKVLKKSEAVGAITANAGIAASGAAAATAAIPVVGPALAPAAAAATFGETVAWVGPAVAALQTGGMLGGNGGVDSALARITPKKERVLSAQQTESFEKLVDHLTAGGGSGQTNITIAPNYSLMSAPDSKTQRQKLVLDLAGDIESAVADGTLRFAKAGA